MRIKKRLKKILEIEKNLDREKLIYEAGKYIFDFRKFNTIRTFGEDIYDGKITLEEADKDQPDLVDNINIFIEKTKPKIDKKEQEKKLLKKASRIFLKQGK